MTLRVKWPTTSVYQESLPFQPPSDIRKLAATIRARAITDLILGWNTIPICHPQFATLRPALRQSPHHEKARTQASTYSFPVLSYLVVFLGDLLPVKRAGSPKANV